MRERERAAAEGGEGKKIRKSRIGYAPTKDDDLDDDEGDNTPVESDNEMMVGNGGGGGAADGNGGRRKKTAREPMWENGGPGYGPRITVSSTTSSIPSGNSTPYPR